MKRFLTIALCAALLASSSVVGFADGGYAELTPDKNSAVFIEDGYIENMENGSTVAELVANFRDRGNVTVTDKNGDAVLPEDTVGSDFVLSYNGKAGAKTYVFGDTNGDAAVNAKDVAVLLKSQAGYSVSLCGKASDVTHDGAVNAKDIASLLKYCAGMNIALEVAHDVAKAENDDPGIDFYLDSVMNRVAKSNTDTAGKDRILTARMAKNETEDVELIVTSDADRADMSFEYSPLMNENGATLDYEFLYGYYYDFAILNSYYGGDFNDLDEGRHVEPIVPLEEGEKFSLEADTSKLFVMRASTTAESEAGLYKATVTLRDADGKAVKVIEFRYFVWDFTLDEKPACTTAFGLATQYYFITKAFAESRGGYEGITGEMLSELRCEWYDYLLENHVSAYDLPFDVLDSEADRYMSDPRVTSFCVDGGGSFQGVNQVEPDRLRAIRDKMYTNPDWYEKAYIYTVDEPWGEDGMATIKNQYDWTNEILGEDRLQICIALADDELFRELDADSAEYMAIHSDILCPQSLFFTQYVSMQEYKLDKSLKPWGYKCPTTPSIFEKFGVFEDRMARWKEEGKKAWWYVCCSPQYPYANIAFKSYKGVCARVLFWQQYMYDVDGFLYFETCDWGDANVTKTSMGSSGDGLLLFDGSLFGLGVTPVSSVRLEYTRDGIEDFQYLAQLEALVGERKAGMEYVNELTTGMLYYTEDYHELESTRSDLGFMLESLYGN